MIKFRHYKSQNLYDTFFGIAFYDRKQPTLDILIGKHVFVMFWKKNNEK